MTDHELVSAATRLEEKLATACPETRLRLQPEFSTVIARLKEEGHPVPSRLRRMEEALMAEAVEARFDNMPI
ncbi:hypothetical protein [Pseudodonghicola flavimaris]|uniref:Uncharacterized protein n=1 Tax=Pseudodonghicola flavimaris TaxID=3050036 RepID=A0ABT7EZ00_9RHOB|nr:hypothetical protein [Pseudodonghicola flavimaris]MDK3017581.1 hypothetical protein [Pseudodonghicola flavimaris]